MSRHEEIASLAGIAEKVEPVSAARSIGASLTAIELAGLLGLSVRQIHILANSGVLESNGRNSYPARQAIGAYINYLRSSRGRDALDAAKLRAAEATARRLEMGNQRASGEVLEASEIKREWVRLVMDLRSAILAASPRVAAASGLDRNAATKLDEELRLALSTIAAKEPAQ